MDVSSSGKQYAEGEKLSSMAAEATGRDEEATAGERAAAADMSCALRLDDCRADSATEAGADAGTAGARAGSDDAIAGAEDATGGNGAGLAPTGFSNRSSTMLKSLALRPSWDS